MDKSASGGLMADMTTRAMSAQAETFVSNIRSGDWDLPIALKNLGIRPDLWLKEAGYGHTVYEWPNTGDRDIGDERAFGGWIAALSDHIVSITMATALEDGEWFTTQELTTRMFRPMQHGLIRVEGRLITRGRTSGYVEAEFTDEKGRLIAKAVALKAVRAREEIQRPKG